MVCSARRTAGRERRQGATLLDVLLGLTIFFLATSGIIASFLSCQQLSEHATNTMRAVSDLDDMIERIYATPFANLLTAFPNGVANGPGGVSYPTIVGGYALDGEQIIVTYPSQATGRLEILVTLNWTHRGRARSTVVSTVRTSG